MHKSVYHHPTMALFLWIVIIIAGSLKFIHRDAAEKEEEEEIFVLRMAEI